MEELWVKLAMNGGPAALITAVGYVLLSRRITDLQDDVSEVKDGKRWTETCDKTHQEVDRRLDRLERFANGSLGVD